MLCINRILRGTLIARPKNDSWGRPIRVFVGRLPAGSLNAFQTPRQAAACHSVGMAFDAEPQG
jgi:hypothetical protein